MESSFSLPLLDVPVLLFPVVRVLSFLGPNSALYNDPMTFIRTALRLHAP